MQTRERHTEYMREWRLKNPEKVKESRIRWKKNNPNQNRVMQTRHRNKDSVKFQQYKLRATSVGMQFTLNQKEFAAIRIQPCHYCGYCENAVGIDRKDNNEGYTLTNSLPCCWRCNRLKGTMIYIDFIKACREISEHLHRL